MPNFLLKVLAGGVKARININNLQAHRIAPGATKSAKIDVNDKIVEGTNHLDLYMGPGMEMPAGANLDIKVVRLDGDGKAAKETKLSAYRWEPAKARLEAQIPTKIWTAEFKVDKAFGRWSWQDAPNTPPTDADQREIVTLLALMHKALSNKDAAAAVDLMKTKIDELARTYGMTAADMTADTKASLEDAFAAKDWSVDPLVAEGTTLVPGAEGRLYGVTDPSGKPPIKATANKQPILFPMSVTRVGGKWVIAR